MPVRFVSLTCLTVALATAGCGVEQAPSTPASAAGYLPAGLFVATPPAGAKSLAEAKSGTSPGDHVVFEARVGGRVEAFVEHRAIFFVADAGLQSCDQIHGESCTTPWDYCCEDPKSLLQNIGTVQVVDASGQPLKQSLLSEHGLEPLRTIVVEGTVQQADTAGNFVVNADRIHVKSS